MSLSAGTRLGPYEILSRIGEGGMGAVWKARDTRLDRFVAIKTSTAKFNERFEREARTVAALNHPHICTLFDVGPDYLVMEYVEGTELRGPLPLEQTLQYAIQIASALEAAHRKGITHRDLKPANILVTKSGVKVLDFGLAKMEQASAAAASDETLTRALTQEGAIVGTLQYMAPEQLQARNIDSRADLFSFGCVLYEMLTGKRAFDGANQASVIAAVLEREPPSVEGVAPASLDWLMRRCLVKDPEDRWQSARDLRAAMERVAQVAVEASNARQPFPLLPWIAFGLTTIFAGAISWQHFREKPADASLMRFNIVEDGLNPRFASPPVISSDGKQIVFAAVHDGKSELWLRPLTSLTARVLPGTESASLPFWSPDGKTIGYFAFGKLQKIDLTSGTVTAVADSGVFGGSWNANGVIVYPPDLNGGLKQISAAGGESRPVTRADPNLVAQRFPRFLPDGKHFLYLASRNPQDSRIRIGSISDSGKAPGQDLELPGIVDSFAEYADGNLLFVRGGTLVARPFDLQRLAFTGEAVTVAEPIQQASTINNFTFSSSATGVLVYRGVARSQSLAWVDRSGKRLSTVSEVPANSRNALLSPDGRTAAMNSRETSAGSPDVWIVDLARGVRTRFTFDPASDSNAVWSPDGKAIVFRSARNGSIGDLYGKPADGSKNEVLLYADKLQKTPDGFSHDGKYLAYDAFGETGKKQDLWILPDPLLNAKEREAAGKRPNPFLSTEFNEGGARFSPDDHWLAYTSDESGKSEVYVTAFPGPGGKRQISNGGGGGAMWRADGKELFYVGPGQDVMSVEIESKGAAIDAGKVTRLFRLPTGTVGAPDVSSDGQKFLLVTPPEGQAPEPLTVVLNWMAGLARR